MFIRNKPIDPKMKYKFDSYIGHNKSWWNYYTQYSNVIDVLVNQIEKDTPIDTVSLPLLFLMRHCLEIALKANILKLEEVNSTIEKIKLNSKSHSLEFLLKKFVEHLGIVKNNFQLNKITIEGIDDYLKKVETLTSQLHKLDKGSFNFRYPVNTEGKYNFTWDIRVNISEIIDMYYLTQDFLVFIENVLDDNGIFFDFNI